MQAGVEQEATRLAEEMERTEESGPKHSRTKKLWNYWLITPD